MTPIRREIYEILEALSQRYPEMRFGQLVVNVANWATRVPDGVWDVTDEDFLRAARQHLERRSAGPDLQPRTPDAAVLEPTAPPGE